jgi:hypothetical protein
MTDKAKKELAYLRRIEKGWYEGGMYLAAKSMRSAADTIEDELHRCRAATLRDIAQEVDILGSSSPSPDDWYKFGDDLRRMAEEAENGDA